MRSSHGAFGIGLVHGMGGSAGVGVLLLAAIPSRELAIAALLVLAVFTAVSMTLVATRYRRRARRPGRAGRDRGSAGARRGPASLSACGTRLPPGPRALPVLAAYSRAAERNNPPRGESSERGCS